MKYTFLLAAFMLMAPWSGHAADPHAMMMQHDMHMPHDIYAPAMIKMHQAMGAVKPTGDADIDFIQGMIPHHQGAVAMAKILLQNGKDPQTRKLATDIIQSQEAEITMMQKWLAAHPQK